MHGIGFIRIQEKEMKFFMILFNFIHNNNNLINNTKLEFKNFVFKF